MNCYHVINAYSSEVGQGGIADLFMPVFQRERAGDQGRSYPVAVFEDFQQVMTLFLIE